MLEPIAYMADKIVLFILAFTGFMINRYIGTFRQGINIMIRKLVLKGLGFHEVRFNEIVERIQSDKGV